MPSHGGCLCNSCEPPTVTLTSPVDAPLDTSSSCSDTSSDEEPCTCENLEELKDNSDKEPYSNLKDACVWILCHKLAIEKELKPCICCYMVAYCSNVCQAQYWPVHKDFCKKVDGDFVKAKVNTWRRWKAENHFCQPSYTADLQQGQ